MSCPTFNSFFFSFFVVVFLVISVTLCLLLSLAISLYPYPAFPVYPCGGGFRPYYPVTHMCSVL